VPEPSHKTLSFESRIILPEQSGKNRVSRLTSKNGKKARRTMDPDDTSSILWRRRCYERVIERSLGTCICVTAASSNGAAVEICSAANHMGGGAY
jgi:hypothetical protein